MAYSNTLGLMAKKFRGSDSPPSSRASSAEHKDPSPQLPLEPSQSIPQAAPPASQPSWLVHRMLYKPEITTGTPIIPNWARPEHFTRAPEPHPPCDPGHPSPSTSASTPHHHHPGPYHLPRLIPEPGGKPKTGTFTLPGIEAMLAGAAAAPIPPQFHSHPHVPNLSAPKRTHPYPSPEPRTRSRRRAAPPLPPSDTTTNMLQSPRQRVSVACTFCRTRKLRCTPGPGPCEHCSRRGHECVFDGTSSSSSSSGKNLDQVRDG